MHFSTRGIRAFCVAAKCLSFKHAATQLYLTPSAVSHQIKDLEALLNCQLFVRKTRSIELTGEGYQFFRAIEPIMDNLELTIREFSEEKQNKHIALALPEFFASELLVPKLSQWTSRYPTINLDLKTVKPKDVSSQAVDLSIVLTGSIPNDGQAHELVSLSYVAAVNKDMYATLANRGLEALNEVPLILHQARPWAWHQWADQVGFMHFEPKQIIQFDSMFGVARAAQQGVGIALVPLPVSRSWFSEEQLIRLFDKELKTRDKYYLVRHEFTEQRPEISLFVEWLIKQFC